MGILFSDPRPALPPGVLSRGRTHRSGSFPAAGRPPPAQSLHAGSCCAAARPCRISSPGGACAPERRCQSWPGRSDRGQEPGGQRQFCGLHDRASRERGLMAAGEALITLEAAAVDEPMLLAIAAGTAEPIGPARLLQSSLTLLLGAVEPLELRQRSLSGIGCRCAP